MLFVGGVGQRICACFWSGWCLVWVVILCCRFSWCRVRVLGGGMVVGECGEVMFSGRVWPDLSCFVSFFFLVCWFIGGCC